MSECNGRATVRVVRTGYVVRKDGRVETASSTVSLVEFGGHRIVVDTGSPEERGALMKAFDDIGVRPDSVEAVVNTHLHLDHSGCNDLFANARSFAHELEEPPLGAVRLSGETTIFPGISVIPTPGHTKGSVSVFVDGRRKCVIAGDALPTKGNFENHTPPSLHFDRNLALRSMEAILAWADVVVPGHDALFEVVRRNNKA
jgi:glyoxylase-like metal-dependent hydrolase (beta-lactamase superfamily II)